MGRGGRAVRDGRRTVARLGAEPASSAGRNRALRHRARMGGPLLGHDGAACRNAARADGAPLVRGRGLHKDTGARVVPVCGDVRRELVRTRISLAHPQFRIRNVKPSNAAILAISSKPLSKVTNSSQPMFFASNV